MLFTFLAARYERKSVIITSNLVFSQWDRIFKDAMTTAAAVDRPVHHSVILELSTKRSYRNDVALERNDNYNDNYEEAISNAPQSRGNRQYEWVNVVDVGQRGCARAGTRRRKRTRSATWR